VTWAEIDFHPPERTLRLFAGLGAIGLCSWGAWAWFRHGSPWGCLALAAGLILVAVGLAWPKAVRPLFVGALILSFPIGWAVSLLLLALIFIGLFVPLGVIQRLMGRDALRRARRGTATSYWIPKRQSADLRRYLRPY